MKADLTAMEFSSIANCSPRAITNPVIFGAEFLTIEASPVWNYTSGGVPNINNPNPGVDARVNFCNITLTHTHPGKSSRLHTQIWLPLNATWNKRWMMAGGGGWSAGSTLAFQSMSAAIDAGYATSTIDGGVAMEDMLSAASWALTSPGNVDYDALQDFASRGLIDGALATKSVIESVYGTGPEYSYWSGCSQGGRQGYMFAERYPDVFDGISANAPAINWNSVFFGGTYPQQVLYELDLDAYPLPCEYDSLTLAAIAACDGNDGLIDGLISDPDGCLFDATTLIGKAATQCHSPDGHVISEAAALAMNALSQGPLSSNGMGLWYGHGHEANATGELSIMASTCSNNGTCVPNRLSLFIDWLKYFVKKDPGYNLNNMTRQEWVSALHAGEREYASIINTNYPDLSDFRASGGKLLTYHGLVSITIAAAPRSSIDLFYLGRPTHPVRRDARLLQPSVYS